MWNQAETPSVSGKKERVFMTIEEMKELHYEGKPCEEEDVEHIGRELPL